MSAAWAKDSRKGEALILFRFEYCKPFGNSLSNKAQPLRDRIASEFLGCERTCLLGRRFSFPTLNCPEKLNSVFGTYTLSRLCKVTQFVSFLHSEAQAGVRVGR